MAKKKQTKRGFFLHFLLGLFPFFFKKNKKNKKQTMSNAQKKAAKLSTLSNTIDQKHAEMMAHFDQLESIEIPKLMEEKKLWKHKLAHLPDYKLEARLEAEDHLHRIRHKIAEYRQERKKYNLDNCRFVFQYLEDKKKVADGNAMSQNVKAINSFFRIKTTASGAEVGADSVHADRYQQSRILYQKYWRNIHGGFTDIPASALHHHHHHNHPSTSSSTSTSSSLPIHHNPSPSPLHINAAAAASVSCYINPHADVCEFCGKGELIAQEEEGILICNNLQCGHFVPHIVENNKPNNKDPPNEVSYTAYIRLNHLKEILSQFQAKQTTKNLSKVIDKVKKRIQKERITDLSTINYEKMREILRNLGLNKYFEHIQYINSIFGIKPPIMSEELYETICVLFIEIQRPWAKHCPPERSNFFNYTYTLYQLCVLLDQSQYLPFIPMMKDRDKQLEQDMIWKKVCEDLDWEFIPTV